MSARRASRGCRREGYTEAKYEAEVPLMVMERLHGETLQSQIDEPAKASLNIGDRSQTTFKKLALEIVNGLKGLHDADPETGARIAHLDVKPENIFYDTEK